MDSGSAPIWNPTLDSAPAPFGIQPCLWFLAGFGLFVQPRAQPSLSPSRPSLSIPPPARHPGRPGLSGPLGGRRSTGSSGLSRPARPSGAGGGTRSAGDAGPEGHSCEYPIPHPHPTALLTRPAPSALQELPLLPSQSLWEGAAVPFRAGILLSWAGIPFPTVYGIHNPSLYKLGLGFSPKTFTLGSNVTS